MRNGMMCYFDRIVFNHIESGYMAYEDLSNGGFFAACMRDLPEVMMGLSRNRFS